MSFNYQQQNLYVESVAISELVTQYNSPLYVYSRSAIEQAWQQFDRAFKQHEHLICYAVKANSNLAVLNVLAHLGSGFDIVSGGELERVLAANGKPSSVIFSGVGKTKAEIKRALEVGIKCFNVESSAELTRIETIAQAMGKVAPIAIRVNPDVDANTHAYIATGLKDNKFGVMLADAVELFQQAHKSQHLQILGIDCHIGSQITEISPFLAALDKILTLAETLKQHGIKVHHLNLGGGVGIKYTDENPINIQHYVAEILTRAGEYSLILEPGRAIVGNAGVFITQVEYLKQNEYKSFAIVNGAMNDLMRPTLYAAKHQVLPVKSRTDGISANWDVVGPICETGDFLAKNVQLNLAQGDYLAIMSAGAYGFAMSSNYNTRPRVAEVMVSGNVHQLVRLREVVQDLFNQEQTFND